MQTIQVEELVNRIKGLDENERLLAVKCFDTDILWDEIRRREKAERQIIAEARKLFRVEED